MFNRFKPRLTYANVMSSIAVFVVLGGGAYATIDRQIRTGDIQNRAITKPKLAKGAVGTAKVERRAIGTGKIKPNAVGIGKMKNNSVGTDQLRNGSVEMDKVANGAIGTEKIADNAVDGQKLAPESVGDIHLHPEIKGVALAGAAVSSGGVLQSWFNRFGGAPSVVQQATGRYVLNFPGLDLNVTDFINQATATSATFVRSARIQSVAGGVRVNFRNQDNNFANTSFNYVVHGAIPTP